MWEEAEGLVLLGGGESSEGFPGLFQWVISRILYDSLWFLIGLLGFLGFLGVLGFLGLHGFLGFLGFLSKFL